MIPTFCVQIYLVRFFRRVVVAKPFRFSFYGHAGSPLILKPNNTHKTRFIAPVRLTNILGIAISKYVSQIIYPIIRFVSVNVVYKTCGPFALRIQPSQSMRFIHSFCNTDSDVTNTFFYAPRDTARFNRFARANSPSKKPCGGIVIKRIFQLHNGHKHYCPPVVSVNINTVITGLKT